MDFELPGVLKRDLERFSKFLEERLVPHLPAWQREGAVPPEFFRAMGSGGWFGLAATEGKLVSRSALWEAVMAERLAAVSPGVVVAVLAHVDLGMTGLHLFGSRELQARHAGPAAEGSLLMCLGSTENRAGSDAAGIGMTAVRTGQGVRGRRFVHPHRGRPPDGVPGLRRG